MIIVSFDDCPDVVSNTLLARFAVPGVSTHLRIKAGLSLAEAVAEVVRQVLTAAVSPVHLVGAGLAASLLLASGALLPAEPRARLLALFPWLGVDSTLYGESAQPGAWPARYLALARRPGLSLFFSRIAIAREPRGLERVYSGGAPSWKQAAVAAPSTEFTSLVVPVSSDTTLVLNSASPHLDAQRAVVLVPALNPRLHLAIARPDRPDLPEAVQAWSLGQDFASGS